MTADVQDGAPDGGQMELVGRGDVEVAGLIVMAYVHACRGRRYALEHTVAAIAARGPAAVREQLDAMADRVARGEPTIDPATPPLAAYRAGVVVAAHRIDAGDLVDRVVAALAPAEVAELMVLLARLAASTEHPSLARAR